MLVTKPTVFFVTDISIIIELLGGLFGIFCFFLSVFVSVNVIVT